MEPYPGIRSFRYDEANIFFGRETLVDHVAERLARDHFVTIAGPSASGKSSLIRAGLLPHLEQRNKCSQCAQWRTITIRPGWEPLRRLIEAVTEQESTSEQALNARPSLNQSYEHWSYVFREILVPSSSGWLLIVDQFEEIFRLNWGSSTSMEESEAFVSALAEISASLRPNVRVILVMRVDFIGDCGRFTGLTELINRSLVLIPPLSREGLLSAITKPLEKVGGAVEAELAMRLVADADEHYPDVLVLMQHLLRRMWARASGHALQVDETGAPLSNPMLTRSGYEAVGGFSHALALHADEVLSALTNEEQRVASGMFKCLTARELGRFLRRPETLGHIAGVLDASLDQLKKVIRPFHQAGLLSMPEQSSEWTSNTLIDVSHEAIIRQWARLKHWAEEEAESGETYARLYRSAQLHIQGISALLRDPELTQVRNWVDHEKPSAQWAERYGGEFDFAMTFLRNSEEAQRQEARRLNSRSPQVPHGVFICYRRDDSSGDARFISETLVKRFGSQQIFIDVDSISPGSDFEEVLRSTLHSCSVVLVLIGIHWLTIADAEGRRRLDNSGDYVRREIRDAMSQELRVIPVLLGRAAMPEESQLPPDIKRVAKLQNVTLKHETFKTDLQELAKQLEQFMEPVGSASRIKRGLTKALQWTRLTPRH